jgi:hypothetical protein
MRVNRAKRRLLKWYRYVDHTKSASSNRRLGRFHQGHAKAYHDVMNAHTWAPNGVREPWRATSIRGGA